MIVSFARLILTDRGHQNNTSIERCTSSDAAR